MSSLCGFSVAILSLVLAGVGAAKAGDEIVLERLSGSVAYREAIGTPSIPVTGSLALPGRDYALTDVRSMAALKLPDSSVISIGETTRVKLGAFLMSPDLSQMRLTIMAGAVHFSVRHPGGARANYVFVTPTSQIAIRGTEGMIVVRPGETIIACVHGTDTDTLVTAKDGSRTFLPPGRTLSVAAMPSGQLRMVMSKGIRAAGFDQFAAIVARNHRMRMGTPP